MDENELFIAELNKILENIRYSCVCAFGAFMDNYKPDAITRELKETEYNDYSSFKTNMLLFGKQPIDEVKNPIIISSHIDTVPTLFQIYSTYDENNHKFFGTYDNLGTNAASIMLMKKEDFPVNVFFAFTADEESGRCRGAECVLKTVYNTNKIGNISKDMIKDRNALFISLDVTSEGYKNNCAFSLEGVHMNKDFRESFNNVLDDFDARNIKFNILPLSETWFDEGIYYGSMGQNACSYCLPTKGNMHSVTGLKVKEQSYIGYIKCLSEFIHELTKEQTLDKNIDEEERDR